MIFIIISRKGRFRWAQCTLTIIGHSNRMTIITMISKSLARNNIIIKHLPTDCIVNLWFLLGKQWLPGNEMVNNNRTKHEKLTTWLSVQPAPANRPWPVNASSSAAPDSGLVITPTSAKPRVDARLWLPLATYSSGFWAKPPTPPIKNEQLKFKINKK